MIFQLNLAARFAVAGQIAGKKGFFRKYGLNVRLNREATSRDGLIFGQAMWNFGLCPWYEYKQQYGDRALEIFGRDLKEDYKVESPEVFIENKGFDPSDPIGYLNSFEIRANTPTRFYMS
ncbi:hypothetical protein [Fischerella sp. JS2]|uniref:hypothetical protein n=1 Tax=Fischerella sp. JS2 TaxID=2597771 RepID=UPI0028E5778C|nr:hypothetical protein [Fischerella sp. JS2]